jgi:hypothetical protein
MEARARPRAPTHFADHRRTISKVDGEVIAKFEVFVNFQHHAVVGNVANDPQGFAALSRQSGNPQDPGRPRANSLLTDPPVTTGRQS